MTDPLVSGNSDPNAHRVELEVPAAGTAVLTSSGRFDALVAAEVREVLVDARIDECSHLVLDLEALTFLDSAGLAVLINARRTMRARGGDVYLIMPREPEAVRVFSLTGFDEVFMMHAPRDA